MSKHKQFLSRWPLVSLVAAFFILQPWAGQAAEPVGALAVGLDVESAQASPACVQAPSRLSGATFVETAKQLTPGCQLLLRDWQFIEDPQGVDMWPSEALRSATWHSVQLPHSAYVEPKVISGKPKQGQVFYKRQLELPALSAGEELWLQVGGAMQVSDWFVDGQHIKHQLGGYLPFSIDLTPWAGKTVELLARLDNRDHALSGLKPLNLLDFHFYSGLYREVSVRRSGVVALVQPTELSQARRGGVRVDVTTLSSASAALQITSELRVAPSALGVSPSAPGVAPTARAQGGQYFLEQRLLDQGRVVASSKSPVTASGALVQQLTLSNPKRWSPNSPALYQLQTRLWQSASADVSAKNATLLEQYQQQIGLRSLRFNANKQLEINGEVTFLRGVNRHQEFPYVGYAVSEFADYRDAARIKDAGFDYVRLSHYPQSRAFMDAADQLGLLLLDAIPGWQYQSLDPQFADLAARTCRDLIQRDYNHPSVLAFECSLNETPMSEALISRLHHAVKDEAPQALSAGWMPGFDLYLQARQHRLQHYTPPTVPYVVSEYGDWEYYAQDAGFAQDQWQNLKAEERTSRQLLGSGEKRLLQQATNLLEAMQDNRTTPAFADGYWVMFDYNRGYAPDLEASGLMSIDRLPKFSFYQFQSQRDANSTAPLAKPMVFIASDWLPSSSLTVRVFSNADQVELRLNGRIVGSKNAGTTKAGAAQVRVPAQTANGVRLPFEFTVPAFEAGTLMAQAFVAGKLVATHQVSTPNTVSTAAIQHITLRSDADYLPAKAHDQVFMYAELRDAQGVLLPLNDVAVQVKTSGDVQLLNPLADLRSEKGVVALLLATGARGGALEVSYCQAPGRCVTASYQIKVGVNTAAVQATRDASTQRDTPSNAAPPTLAATVESKKRAVPAQRTAAQFESAAEFGAATQHDQLTELGASLPTFSPAFSLAFLPAGHTPTLAVATLRSVQTSRGHASSVYVGMVAPAGSNHRDYQARIFA